MIRAVVYALLSAVILTCCLAAAASAAGGAYLDDFQIANNGVVLFSDNFDKGTLANWTKKYDVTTFRLTPDKPAYAMYMNKQHFAASTAYCKPTQSDAGLFELSTRVYLTPTEEQYECWKKHLAAVLQITLYAGTTSSTLRASVYAAPNLDGFKVGITTDRDGCGRLSTRPVLQPGTWAALTMRMDPNAQMATVLIDGRPVQSVPYNPSDFKYIREVGLCSSFGDGSMRSD